MIALRQYQKQAKAAVQKAYVDGLRRVLVVLPTGAGKGHDLETEINTPTGLRLWGDLEVGDEVFGSDGAPTKVTGVFDRGVLPMYRVTMKHGESLLCDADHLWQVKRKGRMPRVVSTEWLLTQPLKDGDGYCWSVPVTAPIARPDKLLPLDPYVVGSLIANGGLAHYGTTLTTPDVQVIERVRRYTTVNTLGVYAGRSCPAYSLPGLTRVTDALGMRVHSRDKRIPRMYLEASIEQRVALLQGLMVADGSVRQGGRRSLTYSTTSSVLAEDMKELITSLGGTCGISKTDRSHSGDPYQEFSLHILLPLDVNAFDTDRKVARAQPNKAFSPRSAIVSIEPAGKHEVRCISVAAADQLYSVTRSHIVTHNTVILADIAKDVYLAGRTVVILVHLDTLVDQTVKQLCRVIPRDAIGIVKASRNEVHKPVIVASVQTLARENRLAQIIPPHLTIPDEAHVTMSDSYQRYFRHVGAVPGGPGYLCGFTATPFRGDKRGLGDIWEKVAFRRSLRWAVDKGFLVEPRAIQYGSGVELDGVRIDKRTDDYSERDLQELVMVDDLRDTVVKGYLELAEGRSAALCAPTKASVRYFLEAFNDAGIDAAEILDDTGKASRIWNFAGFDSGTILVLGSCTALSVGWDCPRCSVLLMVRPTRSRLMLTQWMGRTLRPWPGKDHGLMVDYVGATDDPFLAPIVDLSKTPVQAEGLPCPECMEIICVCDPDEVDDFDRAPIRRTAKKITGVTEIDLFAGTNARWLRTARGVPFVQTAEHTFYIAMDRDTGDYYVGRCGSRSIHGGVKLAEGLTSDEALELGSGYALAEDQSLASRTSSWRKGRQPPSENQVEAAKRLRVPYEGLSKAELSDAISIRVASGLLAGIGA